MMNTKLPIMIATVTVLMILKIVTHVVNKYNASKKLCLNCNGVMLQDLIAVGIASIYLVIYRAGIKGLWRMAAFYSALIVSVYMSMKIAMAVFVKLSGRTPVAIGVAAAAAEAAEIATVVDKSESETDVKRSGQVIGASAAAAAAENAGLTDDEVIEATIAGAVVGEKVAEAVAKL